MGLTALLPLRRKACWGFFRPEKSRRLQPGLNPRTWVLKGSTLPLDHRSREVTLLLAHFVLPTGCAIMLTHYLTAVHARALRWQSVSNLMLSCSFSHTFCFVFGEICLYCNGHIYVSAAGGLALCWYFLCGQFTLAFSEHPVVFRRKQLLNITCQKVKERRQLQRKSGSFNWLFQMCSVLL